MTKNLMLTSTDHNRDVVGMRFVYPVVSRRAGGVSIGINLNTNNACNWRCIYCNVPNLTRGMPPPIELNVLERELRVFLNDVLYGDFMLKHVAEADRQLQDIAFSGNGEPTSAKEFPQVIDLVAQILCDFDLINKIKLRLITNGSLMYKPAVLDSVRHLAACNGEVWFKVDAGSQDAFLRSNDVLLEPQQHLNRLKKCAEICPTWIQTCLFSLDNVQPTEAEIAAYIALISQAKHLVKGVHLYGLARQSLQPEASRLSRLPVEWLESVADKLRATGFEVQVSA